jgi:ATP/maltotriose-dependent transcriptional regulator MalT
MSTPILATKLYIPPPRPHVIRRPRLIARLNAGLHRKLTLISAPAGFGKTTLVSEWLTSCARPAAWLSLDEEDNDPTRFVMYLVAALQTLATQVGAGVLGALQSSQSPPAEALLTTLLNDIATDMDDFILVLDDYHVIAARPIDDALAFLLEHLPPQMHLVITTREDPHLPLARLRARDQLTELRAAASRAYREAMSMSQASGNVIIYLSAATALGTVQEAEHQLYQAAQTYRSVLQQVGESPMLVACEAQLGMARLCYEWNDLAAAQLHVQQSRQLASQFHNADRCVTGDVLLARLKLALGEVADAAAMLGEAEQMVCQHNLTHRMPAVAAARVRTLLHQGNLAAAAQLAQAHALPISQARVHLAQGNPSAALAALEPWRQRVEARALADERLKALVLQSLAWQAQGATDKALHALGDALALAEPGGFVRIFVDEGDPMARLLSTAAARGMMPNYIGKLLAAYEAERQKNTCPSLPSAAPPLLEPLSQRETEVLFLIAQGLSNQEISARLCLALDTVKGHNRRIFGKLQVQRRTEAVARARALGLL